jgi:drug/metabolite transporter (DMT)-like permease
VAIAFVMPFIMLILGKLILKEDVGARRIWACLVGFAGTMMVVQPSFAQVGWPALLPIGVAVNFAFFMLITRQIARQTDPVGLQAVSAFIAMGLLAPALWLLQGRGIAGADWIAVSGQDMGLLVAIGLCGTAAHLLMTWSLKFAPSATLAPMQYLEIPVATLLGFVVFSDLPNGMASAGIMVTICAGLYVILRERAIATRPQVSPEHAPPAV